MNQLSISWSAWRRKWISFARCSWWCCDRKARAACAQSCGSKQQYKSPDEITPLLLVRATYIWVLFFAPIPVVVNCVFNATPTERLQHWVNPRWFQPCWRARAR